MDGPQSWMYSHNSPPQTSSSLRLCMALDCPGDDQKSQDAQRGTAMCGSPKPRASAFSLVDSESSDGVKQWVDVDSKWNWAFLVQLAAHRQDITAVKAMRGEIDELIFYQINCVILFLLHELYLLRDPTMNPPQAGKQRLESNRFYHTKYHALLTPLFLHSKFWL